MPGTIIENLNRLQFEEDLTDSQIDRVREMNWHEENALVSKKIVRYHARVTWRQRSRERFYLFIYLLFFIISIYFIL